jgi:hypothetical protein
MTDDSKKRLIIGVLVAMAGFVVFVGYQNTKEIRRTLTPAVIHSKEKNSPYSTLTGTTVQIQPYGASFEIPEAWLTQRPAPDNNVKNLFLSWEDLNEVNRIDRKPYGFDTEDAEVINAVLPFEDCVAHVGDRGWGNSLWNDLQARIYITQLRPEEIVRRLETAGLRTAQSNFEDASFEVSKYKEWSKFTFKILDAPTHFILYKRLAFFLRRENDATVVFVFLHADPFEEEIALLLNSFRWEK